MIKPLNFNRARQMLKVIHDLLGPGYKVSFTFDGNTFYVSAAFPEKFYNMYTMKFDQEGDFLLDSNELAKKFIDNVHDWYIQSSLQKKE